MSEQINSYVVMQAVKEAETLKHEELVVTLNTIKDIMNNLATTIREGNETSIIKQAFKNQIDELGDYFQIIADLEDAAEEIRQNKKRSFMGSVAAFLEAWNGPDEGFVRIIRVKKGKEEVVELSYKCLDPSLVTEDVFEESYSSVLMSGTLTPLDMYKDLLGLSDSCMLESFSSPFPEENKLSLIVPSVTTKYNKRGEDQFKRIAFICVGATDSTPGNSVVFFPSYELLNKVNHYFQYSCKKTLFLEQPGMTKQDKFELLEKFRQYKDSGAILLSVISGSFGEGIDLPGDYLKTVIVVGLPLQTPNLETKALIDYYDQKFGDGWNYGYVYPAFNKTLQSAGRCIRSETDRGVVLFLDERYLWPNYFKCFPEAHRPEVDLNYVDRINSFFEK
jgi:DNA excision repair protein ERCC-2